jgi:hypothetical protein
MGVIPFALLFCTLLPQIPTQKPALALPSTPSLIAPQSAMKGEPKPAAENQGAHLGVAFDPATGWPKTSDVAKRPEAETRAALREISVATGSATGSQPADFTAMQAALPAAPFRSMAKPAEVAALGVLLVSWRITVFSDGGAPIGTSDVNHLCDLAAKQRDRLEHADGRIFGRCGTAVSAERNGAPFPTLLPFAAQELELFGMHLRLPFGFADRQSFDELGSESFARNGETLLRVLLQRHPSEPAPMGPPVMARPADHYELICEPATGQVREVEYSLAGAKELRRVRLEDWRRLREATPVVVPFRRVYLDAESRKTLVMEIVKVESKASASEREFRLY